jgi:polyisoprenoid-binding protein YceI
MRWSVVVLLFAWTGAAAEELTLDPSRSELVVHVKKKGLFSPLLHDHHLRPERMSGTLAVDPARPERIELTVTVAADSLHDDQPRLSDADRRKVEAQVRGGSVLDAAHYPRIVFSAREVNPTAEQRDGGRVRAEGVLTATLSLHGRELPVAVPFVAIWSGNRLSASGRMAFNQSDFGIHPQSQFGGTVGIEDRVNIEFKAEFETATR